MTTSSSRRRRSTAVVAGLALAALAACASPDTPTGDDPAEPAPSVSVDDVRTTLGTIDPCALLDDGGLWAPSPRGPHTCEAQLDDVRVRVEVGVPVDEADLADAERDEIAGLVAYTVADGCSTVFPVGPAHGIAVSMDERCQNLRQAADPVGAAIADADINPLGRPSGPDAHTACGLMSGATTDPALLVDAAGEQLQGLDHCELASGPVLARTGLSIDYSSTPFDEVARLLKGERVEIDGQDAVVRAGETGCYVHTFLWPTEAGRRGEVHAEAVVRAADCDEARDVAGVVIRAASSSPAAPGSIADLVAASQP